MNSFEIKKEALKKGEFTSINTSDLGRAVGELKLCGIKLYTYLIGHINGWTLNPVVYAEWLGIDYSDTAKARSVRKMITDGINDLLVNGYLKPTAAADKFIFSEHKET